jgi:outer membrane usher protein
LTFGTALAFADGYFAWSRPVDNSFALVVPYSNFKGQRIGINPTGKSYFGLIDNLGSGVISNLRPYNISNLIIDSSKIPLGYDLGKNFY